MLYTLQWARAHGCPWDSTTCSSAAFGRRLEVLQWARANGADRGSDTAHRAAEGGHLKLLQCPLRFQACQGSIQKCHLDTLAWAVANDCRWCKSSGRNGSSKRALEHSRKDPDQLPGLGHTRYMHRSCIRRAIRCAWMGKS